MFASIRLFVAAAATVAALPAAANAAPTIGEPQSIEIRYDDLNLASDAGAARLARRVALATAGVCGTADVRDLSATRAIKACRRETMAATAPRVETAVAAARSDVHFAEAGGSGSPEVAAD